MVVSPRRFRRTPRPRRLRVGRPKAISVSCLFLSGQGSGAGNGPKDTDRITARVRPTYFHSETSSYYGGMQMNPGFQRHYGGWMLRHFGTDDHWSPRAQLIVAYRGWKQRSWSPCRGWSMIRTCPIPFTGLNFSWSRWDADRLDLGRVSIEPDPELMSTAAGRERARLRSDARQEREAELLGGDL
jgi:hypothetical protein